ncbi:NF-kappa-B essential modulator isoform X2 [Orussus abietinus]|nr:NF-kappa-B essential modulator isoform X2 [Orussus abietinus]
MKQQFNTLAAWHEEVIKVHQSHKQKFSETREFINQLKSENTELKAKLAEYSMKCQSPTPLIKELKNCMAPLKQDDVHWTTAPTQSLKELQQQPLSPDKLLKKLDLNYEDKNLKTNVQVPKENVTGEPCSSSNDFSLLNQPSLVNDDSKSQRCIDEQNWKQNDVRYQRQLVASLNEELQFGLQNVSTPVPIATDLLENHTANPTCAKISQNVKHHYNTLTSLVNCYANHSRQCTSIQDCLQECSDILNVFDDSKILVQATTESHVMPPKEIQFYASKLLKCRSKLMDEQLRIISHRQELIKVLDEIQIFSDYDSSFYELETMNEEHAKFCTLQNQTAKTHETLEDATNAQKCIEEKKKLLELEKRNLEEKRKTLDEERESLVVQRQSLNAKVEELQSEQSLLSQERMLLNQQHLLYEAQKKSLLCEKKVLQSNNEELIQQVDNLNTKLASKEQELDDLKMEINTFKKEIEKMYPLKMQLDVFENDFKEEREARQALLQEKETLLQHINGLQQRNQLLETAVRGTFNSTEPTSHEENSQSQVSKDNLTASPFVCPVCCTSFLTVEPLQVHVEECLNSN